MSKKKKPNLKKLLNDFGNQDPLKDYQSQMKLMSSLEYGEEPHKIFKAIVQNAIELSDVDGAGLYLPRESSEDDEELLALAGNFNPIENVQDINADNKLTEALSRRLLYYRQSGYYFFEVTCLGAPIGALVLETTKDLNDQTLIQLRTLAHHAAVTHERMRLTRTLQHFLDRVEVLNELNQLIASNVSLQKLVRQISRESAFRFTADVSFTYLLNEEANCLQLKGGYGCSPQAIPREMKIEQGIIGQLMRLRGNVSINDLSKQYDPQLNFLLEFETKSVHACCLEVRNEVLGILIVGYKREKPISHQELTRFEEFCQGSAVAIANTLSQERITSYTERLEELVENRTADLAIQTARAEKANEAKSRFLANMSHELRTPLTAILGYASVLADGIFGALSEKQEEALGAVVRSSEHLKRLINDVLNLARIESGKEEVEPENIEIESLIEQLHKLMMQQALEKGVKLKTAQISPELAGECIYADAKHIRQILINLLSNGVKYTPSGGEVSITISSHADKVKIEIKDSGVGIPAERCKTLFERFERGDNNYSLQQEGTGIGLNLTKQLIQLNAGFIGVESQEGVGSNFWILLPKAQVKTHTQKPEIKIEKKSYERLDGLKVLVVDDDATTRGLLEQILKAAGAVVNTANDVASGKQQLEQDNFDIVLTDLAMPVESGLVLIKQVREASDNTASIPILVVSACAFEKDRTEALDAGGSKFLAKPFQPTEIVEAVRELTINSALQA